MSGPPFHMSMTNERGRSRHLRVRPSTYRVAVTMTARKSTLPWQTAWYDAEPTVWHRVTSRTSSAEERRETGCREARPLERAGDRGRTGDVQLTRIAERRLSVAGALR